MLRGFSRRHLSADFGTDGQVRLEALRLRQSHMLDLLPLDVTPATAPAAKNPSAPESDPSFKRYSEDEQCMTL